MHWLKITLGVLLAVAVIAAAVAFLLFRALSGPIDEANEFLAEMKAKDYPGAYALTEPSCSNFDQETLASVFSEADIVSYNLRQTNQTKSTGGATTGTASGEVRFADGALQPITVFLTKFGEEWKVCGFGVGE